MKEIQKVSMTDAAVESIRENILSGAYEVGDKLPTESQYCAMLGVSRTTVREALRVLTALGYVSIKPGRGAFVARLSEVAHPTGDWFDLTDISFHDVMEVRMSIEEISVRLAIERARDAQIQTLAEVHDSFLEANRLRNSARMLMIDELFHTTIAEISGNKLLMDINRQLAQAFKRYRGSSFVNDETYGNAIEPHEKILAAFRDGDAAAGVAAMHAHMLRAIEDIDAIRNRS